MFYTLEGSEPDNNSQKYTAPIKIDQSVTLRAKAFKTGLEPSLILSEKFKRAFFRKDKSVKYPNIAFKNKYSSQYTGGDDQALLDGIYGSTNFRDGKWQGFQEVDFDATIDLGKPFSLKRISTNFLSNQGSWIFLPAEIKFAVSEEGQNFQLLGDIEIPRSEKYEPVHTINVGRDVEIGNVRFIKVVAKNIGHLPDWHRSAGGRAWIFVDEIVLEY